MGGFPTGGPYLPGQGQDTNPYGGGGDSGGTGLPGQSSNQYFNPLPPAPQVSPGIVPPGRAGSAGVTNNQTYFSGGGPNQTESTAFPGFTAGFKEYLENQMGKGASPFDLSAALPTGGATAPGQMTAPMNQMFQDLMSFYQTGQSNTPGLSTLGQMSSTGMPVDQLPAWQAMVDAQKRNVDQGAESIREQMAFSGNLKSSPFGNALTDYFSQTKKDQNAMLLDAQSKALEAARGRQVGTSEFLTAGMANLGQVFQDMDQGSIDRLLTEFIRTRPEYGPLLNAMFGLATTFPPVVGKNYGIGAGGALLGSAGGIASGVSDIINAIKNKGGSGGGGSIYPGGGGGSGGSGGAPVGGMS